MRESRAKTGFVSSAALAFAFACLMALLPGTSQAAWSSPEVVSGPGSSVSQTTIAGGSDGTSWVVWKRDVGGFDVIQGTRVQPDGTPGPVATISGASANATDPVIAARANGSAVVAWLNTSTAADSVESAALGADGSVGPIVNRSDVGAAGEDAKDVAVAVGDDGTAALTWLKFDGTNWIVHAVRINSDGSSGTIHGLSDTAVSSGPPAIAFKQLATYRVAWPQGTGPDSNVGSVLIETNDTVSPLYLALSEVTSGGTGGDPQNVHVSYGNDLIPMLAFIRHRRNVDPSDGTEYFNWAVEMVRPVQLLPGIKPELNPALPTVVTAVTPTVPGEPYDNDQLTLATPHGGQPVMAWRHDLGPGQYRIESGRIMNSTGAYQAWVNATGVTADATEPVIAANASGAGAIGWDRPSASNIGIARFSDATFESGGIAGFDSVSEPGMVMPANGVTLAAYTTSTAGVSSARVSVFVDPGVATFPPRHQYGKVNVGVKSTRSIVIRSTGQTPVTVTGINLGGANAGQFSLARKGCVKSLNPGAACTFTVTFKPGSTGSKSAQVTVNTNAGSRVTQLVGNGANRTRLRVSSKPGRKMIHRKGVARVRVQIRNVGGVTANNTRVCADFDRWVLRVNRRCVKSGALAKGAQRRVNFQVRLRDRAKKGKRYPVIFRVRANNAVERLAISRIGRRR